MMCFLYDEQFPVLPDIIQISGPFWSSPAKYHLRHNQWRWRTKDLSDELAFILIAFISFGKVWEILKTSKCRTYITYYIFLVWVKYHGEEQQEAENLMGLSHPI